MHFNSGSARLSTRLQDIQAAKDCEEDRDMAVDVGLYGAVLDVPNVPLRDDVGMSLIDGCSGCAILGSDWAI
jgi:hypothetical protein